MTVSYGSIVGCSNEAVKRYVRKNYNVLVDKLEPTGYLLNTLFQEEVISIAQKFEILRLSTKEKRSEALLDYLLLANHPETFIVLRKALLKHYHTVVVEIDSFTRQGK